MAVLHSPESNYSKERIKHEAQASAMGPGLRPYVYRQFPMMWHLAGRPDGGLGPHTIVETVIVDEDTSDAQRDHLRSRGFRDTPLEAIAALDAQRLEFAKLAAEINYDVRHKLGEHAKAEVEAAQAAHSGHLPMVPETPIVHRVPKVEAAAAVTLAEPSPASTRPARPVRATERE